MDRIGSWDLVKKFNMQHRVLQRAVRNANKDLIEIDLVFKVKSGVGKRARPIEEYLLTEAQWKVVCRYLRECEGNRGIKNCFLSEK